MKKMFVLVGLVCATSISFAQSNKILATGYVGIGTINPSNFLHVVGNSLTIPEVRLDHYYNNFGASTLQFRKARGTEAVPAAILLDDYMIGLEGWGYTGTSYKRSSYIVSQASGTPTAIGVPSDLIFATSTGGADATEGMRLDKNGFLGLGTMTPTARLEVNGTSIIGNSAGTNYNENLRLPSSAAGFACIALGAVAGGAGTGAGQWSLIKFPALESSRFSIRHNNDDFFSISTSGNIGMGINNPLERLAVNGKIRAKEIKVEMTGWSDFVFEKDYALPTLQETEKHIREKGHLPGIPSAAEVEKNGVELGDMNKKLLQKIEELTLYLIEMKKENESAKKRLAILENKSIQTSKSVQ